MGFANDIENFTLKAKGRTDVVVRKVALDLHRSVVKRTPVDTGRARSNWNVSIDYPDSSTTDTITDTGGYGQPPRGINAEQAIALINKIKTGKTIFITNNLDYIQYLEKGSSKQNPSGMVAVTLRNYPGIVSDGVREAKQEVR